MKVSTLIILLFLCKVLPCNAQAFAIYQDEVMTTKLILKKIDGGFTVVIHVTPVNDIAIPYNKGCFDLDNDTIKFRNSFCPLYNIQDFKVEYRVVKADSCFSYVYNAEGVNSLKSIKLELSYIPLVRSIFMKNKKESQKSIINNSIVLIDTGKERKNVCYLRATFGCEK